MRKDVLPVQKHPAQAEWFHKVLKSQGTVVDSTHSGRQNKLNQQAKRRVRDVIKLRLQCELFPPLMSEGNCRKEKEKKENTRTGFRGRQGASTVQECGGLCTAIACKLLRHSQFPNSYLAYYFLLLILRSQEDRSAAKSGDAQRLALAAF